MFYFHYIWIELLRRKFRQEWPDVTPAAREVKRFHHYLETVPIHIHDEDLFAGWFGTKTYEELEIAILGSVQKQEENVEKVPVTAHDYLSQNYGTAGHDYDVIHHIIDYKTVLNRGVSAYIEDVEKELSNPDNSAEKQNYLQAMKEALFGAEIFAGRFADLAEEKAEQAKDEADRKRFLHMAKTCRKVPMLPPENFYEALQATYLLRALCGLSYLNMCSVSLGSFDRFMYPYYEISRKQGMSREEAIQLLLQFFAMLEVYGGEDCTLSIGGMDEDGNDTTNELSYVLIEAEKRSKLRAPLFCVRVNENTPEELMRQLISKELFEMGQPTFYGEEPCQKAMMYRGLDEKTASAFEVSSCMCLTLPDCEATSAWGCILNTHLPLELAINGGRPLSGELPIDFQTKPKTEYKNLDEIFEQYASYMAEIFEICKIQERENTLNGAKNYPNPWLSALTADCIKRGKDRWDGGVLYNSVVVENMAFANTADAFTAIDTLVFGQKKYTLKELIQAAAENYVGHEDLRKELLSCPKYGTGNRAADENAKRVLAVTKKICEKSREGNLQYLPSLHTLWADVTHGEKYHAMLDGRRAGEPYNKNAGPTTMARKAGPTCAAIGAANLGQEGLSGGQALDVHFGIRNLDSVENRDKIAAFIRTYFRMGGLQLQVNGVSSDTLQKAYDEPEKYPDLMVRIGGHSRYFMEFSDTQKKEYIRRFQVEEGALRL